MAVCMYMNLVLSSFLDTIYTGSTTALSAHHYNLCKHSATLCKSIYMPYYQYGSLWWHIQTCIVYVHVIADGANTDNLQACVHRSFPCDIVSLFNASTYSCRRWWITSYCGVVCCLPFSSTMSILQSILSRSLWTLIGSCRLPLQGLNSGFSCCLHQLCALYPGQLQCILY